ERARMRGLLVQDQKIASKLAPTGPLESITYFMFDRRLRSYDLPPTKHLWAHEYAVAVVGSV
ncbi:MAG TPA: hypothetical protein DIT33_05980, partial [Pseudomonas sp.]|nr:hypothetical protein [Pseudomonas sp.]